MYSASPTRLASSRLICLRFFIWPFLHVIQTEAIGADWQSQPMEKLSQCTPALGTAYCAGFRVPYSARWRHQERTPAATDRNRSATRSGVSPLLINASAPEERAAC